MSTERERVEREARGLIPIGPVEIDALAASIASLILRERAAAFEAAARTIERLYRTESDALRREDAHFTAAGVRSRVRKRDALAIRALAAAEREPCKPQEPRT
jgi:hypothetical protein